MLAVLQISMLGPFRERHALTVHSVGAGILFVDSLFYCSVHTRAHKLVIQNSKKLHVLYVCACWSDWVDMHDAE